MKFDYAAFNPPYQESTIGDNDTFAPPVYDKFMDAAFEVSDTVVTVHPARFLFNAGSTPKAWNKKMLSDPDYKILMYKPNSKDVFPDVEIKGGVAISIRKANANYGAIEVFTPDDELNSIFKKIHHSPSFKSLSEIMVSSYAYHFTQKLLNDYGSVKQDLSKGHEFDFKSNVFEKIPYVFEENDPKSDEYLRILGRLNNSRTYRYIKKEYVKPVTNLYKYKIFLPGAIGTGKYGESIPEPVLGCPADGATETFLSIGSFESQGEALNLRKYVMTKFSRALLGIMKRTQANTPGKWLYVPLQDFTENSDIDWSKSISEIDQQLYRKYGLSDKEIDFIEEKVQAME